MGTQEKSKNLGEILVDMGVLTPDALKKAVDLQSRRLGQILIDENLIDATTVAHALKLQAMQSGGGQPLKVDATFFRKIHDSVLKMNPTQKDFQEKAEQKLLEVKNTLEAVMVSSLQGLKEKILLHSEKISQDLKKEVSVEFHSDILDLDTSLFAELQDIAFHFIKNAITHGKKDKIQITVKLELKNGLLYFSVKDDGVGLQKKAIWEKAVKKKLISKDFKDVIDEDLKKIIFSPGFSTADSVDIHSGRGIGLDVVETAALKLGGTVEVHSTENQGAEFAVKIPLTYAVVPVLNVKAADHLVGFFSNQIKSVSISKEEGGPYYKLSSFFEGSLIEIYENISSAIIITDQKNRKWLCDEVGVAQKVFIYGVHQNIAEDFNIVATSYVPGTFQKMIIVDLNSVKAKS